MRIQQEGEKSGPTLWEVVQDWLGRNKKGLTDLAKILNVRAVSLRHQLLSGAIPEPTFSNLQNLGVIAPSTTPEDYGARYSAPRRSPSKNPDEKLSILPLYLTAFWNAEFAQKLAATITSDGGNAETKMSLRGLPWEVAPKYKVIVHAFGPGKSAEDYRKLTIAMQKEDEEEAERKGI